MAAIRVILIDDHTMFREGLLGILSSREDIEIVGDSPTGEEALALLRERRPDMVITQIDMDLHKAKEILARVREASPASRIVVLTIFDNLRYVQALSRLGIDAYVHKSSSSEELLATIRSEAVRMALVEQWIGLTEITEAAPDGYERDGITDA